MRLYREQSSNSERSFLASFWPKGGVRWNVLRARQARKVFRWNRDCSLFAPFIIIHLFEIIDDFTPNFYS